MDAARVLAQLQQPQHLSILRLAQPILTQSDGSNTPSALSADLAHYRDLFSKLRFSYVEQVTKERFLRNVCAEAPEFVTAADNAALEERLKGEKASLKEKKTEVAEMILALEAQGLELARRYEHIQLQIEQLQTLPAEITNLTETIRVLKERQESNKAFASDDPDLALPLPQMRDRLREREQELQRMDLEIERLRASIPAKQAETQRLQDELAPLQLRKIKAVEEAQEARRRRDQGGMADELEEKGRWLKGVETSLKSMLEV